MPVITQTVVSRSRLNLKLRSSTAAPTLTVISPFHILVPLELHGLLPGFAMAYTLSASNGVFRSGLLLLLVSFLSLVDYTSSIDTQYVQSTNSAGETLYLADDRKPALYTQNFGDCLGSSLINVTRFDAAYYQDNMTVLFHLEGRTNVANESIMSTYWRPFISDGTVD